MSSSAGQDVDAFHGPEYEAIEHAVMESPRGRWFLAEYAKRNRTADTRALLGALKKLEDAVGAERGAEPALSIPDFAQAYLATRAEIAAMRNDMLPDGGIIANDNEVFDTLSEEARSHADRFTRHSERLEKTTAGLRVVSGTGDSATLIALETEIHAVRNLSQSNEFLSRRIVKAMGLLTHVGRSIAGLADAETAAREARYFESDEEFFEAPVIETPAAATVPDHSRITVTRRSNSDDVSIPLAFEADSENA